MCFVYLLHIGFDLRGRSRGGGEIEEEAGLRSILRLKGRPIRICEFWRDGRKPAGLLTSASSGTCVLSSKIEFFLSLSPS